MNDNTLLDQAISKDSTTTQPEFAFKVDNAIIIADGFGDRFVPLTFHTPKGLLKVFGEPMIERQIKQLHEAGIFDITIIVGYLKESFAYLIDKYQVTLLYNPDYRTTNTIVSLYHGRHLLKNTYVLSSDHWIKDSIFHPYEDDSWYSSIFIDQDTSKWCLDVDKENRIISIEIGGSHSDTMYGPAFFSKEFSIQFVTLLEEYHQRPDTESYYWEQIIKDHTKELTIYKNPQPEEQIRYFKNLEGLRLFDSAYCLDSEDPVLKCISTVFKVSEDKIKDIRSLKAGMTNKSFTFTIGKEHYIFRSPGFGTSSLINRFQEKASYKAVSDLAITDEIIYFDGQTGYKIAKYYVGSRNPSAHKKEDITNCMTFLKNFHKANKAVAHSFDMRERIAYYEDLCYQYDGIHLPDYEMVHESMNLLMDRLDQMQIPQQLSHVDSMVDNFLILEDGSIKLLDWEYSGMCDPLIDIAMYAIYAYYNIEETEFLMESYFGRSPGKQERIRVYSYMALAGFLWTLWCEYKSALGEEFGEYVIAMYQYAKEYSSKVEYLAKDLHTIN